MIIVVQTGRSFKGAGLYFLHDKRENGEKERLTDNRVAWTDSFNTLHADPERVLREMQATSINQNWLRQQAGHVKGGRPTEKCVMSVSLSWHPEQNPDAAHMRDAARDFLKHMGYGEHQALVVAHNDTAHKHLHILVNTIHPENGLTLDRNWSRLRAGEWRMQYERQHGQTYTRAAGAAGRDAAQRGEWQAWDELNKEGRIDPEHAAALIGAEWRTLKESQRQERLHFFKESAQARRELRNAIRLEVRAEFAPAWQTYTKERDQRQRERLAYDRETRRALRHYRRHGPLAGMGAVQQVRERQKAYHTRVRDELADQRGAIHHQVAHRAAALLEPAMAFLAKDRAEAYQELLKDQRSEKVRLGANQSKGIRRPDLLDYESSMTARILTVQQIMAYKHQAIAVASREQEMQQSKRFTTGQRLSDLEADAGLGSNRAMRANEQQQRSDRPRLLRQMSLARALAQRKADRESEGRESSGRER